MHQKDVSVEVAGKSDAAQYDDPSLCSTLIDVVGR